MPHRIEVNVQTGEIQQIELTPEELAAIPAVVEPEPPPPPTRAELLAQLPKFQGDWNYGNGFARGLGHAHHHFWLHWHFGC